MHEKACDGRTARKTDTCWVRGANQIGSMIFVLTLLQDSSHPFWAQLRETITQTIPLTKRKWSFRSSPCGSPARADLSSQGKTITRLEKLRKAERWKARVDVCPNDVLTPRQRQHISNSRSIRSRSARKVLLLLVVLAAGGVHVAGMLAR